MYRIDKKTNKQIAIKVINLDSSDNDYDDVILEVRFLNTLRHPNIVSIHQSFVYGVDIWLVMELCSGGSCSDLLKYLNFNLGEDVIAFIIYQALSGLRYLHSLRRLHRDIKSANILITGDGIVKLGDFGVSSELTRTLTHRATFVGTPFWMAPEVINQSSKIGSADCDEDYDDSSDDDESDSLESSIQTTTATEKDGSTSSAQNGSSKRKKAKRNQKSSPLTDIDTDKATYDHDDSECDEEKNTGYNTKADIWSLGVTVYELAQGDPPHSHMHPMKAIWQISTRPSAKLPKFQAKSGFPERFNGLNHKEYVSFVLSMEKKRQTLQKQLYKSEASDSEGNKKDSKMDVIRKLGRRNDRKKKDDQAEQNLYYYQKIGERHLQKQQQQEAQSLPISQVSSAESKNSPPSSPFWNSRKSKSPSSSEILAKLSSDVSKLVNFVGPIENQPDFYQLLNTFYQKEFKREHPMIPSNYSGPHFYSKDLANFISQCLTKDPNLRPGCLELMNSSFIAKFFGPTEEDAKYVSASKTAFLQAQYKLRDLLIQKENGKSDYYLKRKMRLAERAKKEERQRKEEEMRNFELKRQQEKEALDMKMAINNNNNWAGESKVPLPMKQNATPQQPWSNYNGNNISSYQQNSAANNRNRSETSSYLDNSQYQSNDDRYTGKKIQDYVYTLDKQLTSMEIDTVHEGNTGGDDPNPKKSYLKDQINIALGEQQYSNSAHALCNEVPSKRPNQAVAECTPIYAENARKHNIMPLESVINKPAGYAHNLNQDQYNKYANNIQALNVNKISSAQQPRLNKYTLNYNEGYANNNNNVYKNHVAVGSRIMTPGSEISSTGYQEGPTQLHLRNSSVLSSNGLYDTTTRVNISYNKGVLKAVQALQSRAKDDATRQAVMKLEQDLYQYEKNTPGMLQTLYSSIVHQIQSGK